MTKRKRASGATAQGHEHLTGGDNAIAGPSTPTPSSVIKEGVRPRHSVTFSTPGIVTPSPSKRVGPQIVFVLADGSKSWRRPLDGERTFVKWTKKALKRFDIEADPGQVRLSHVRDHGREVDIWDEYDFSAFRMRSFANPSSESIIKIYPPSSSLSVPSSSTSTAQNPLSTPELQPVTPTPVSKRSKNKGKASPASPATPLDVSEVGTTPTANKGKKAGKGKGKGKEVEISGDIETPATPAVQLVEENAATPIASASEKAESLESTIPTGTVPSETTSSKGAAKKKRKRDSVIPEAIDPSASTSINSPTPTTAEQRELSPQKKKQKKKKRDSTVPETPPVEPLSPSPSIEHVDATALRPPLVQSKSLLDRYKPIKPSPLGREEVDAASENGSENTEMETPGKNAKKKEKAKAKRQKRKSQVMPADETVENIMGTNNLDVEQIEEETAVELTPSTPDNVVDEPIANDDEPTEIALPSRIVAHTPSASNRTKQILISTPRILHAKPNSPPMNVTSRFNSSSISRSPPPPPAAKKIASKTARQAKEPSVDLESEEGAGSPSPRWETIASHVPSDEIDQLVSSPVLEPLSIVDDEEEEDSGKKDMRQRKRGRKSLPVVNGTASDDEVEVQSPRTVKKKAPISAKKAAKVSVGAADENPVDAETANGRKSSSPPPIPSLSSTSIHLSSSGSDASPAVGSPASNNTAHAPIPAAATPPAPIKGKSVRAQLARLAQRGACVICYGPSHLQLDCPRVKAGINSLKELLAARKVEEDTGTTEQSIEVIEMWIDRLGRIAKAVKGNSNPASPANKQNASAVALTSHPSKEPTNTSPPLTPTGAASVAPSPQRKTAIVTAAQVITPSVPTSTEAASKSSQNAAPPSPPREHNLPPIHLKALATRKAGSISGLSVSDAVIETESSASESDDEEDVVKRSPVNRMAQMKRRDSFESEKGTGSGSESDRLAEEDDQADHEEINGGSPSKSFSNRSGSRSRSASASSSSAASIASTITATSSSSAPNISVPMHDSQAALDHFLTMPLSQRQKRAARQSAAAMQTIEVDEVEAEDASEVESDDEPVPRLAAHGRRGSESSVGEFGEDDVDPDSLAEDEDEVMPFSQAPPVLSSSQHELEPKVVDDNEIDQSASLNGESDKSDQSRHSRSFADLAALSSPSPMLAEFPGDIAVQDTIREDEMLSLDHHQPGSSAHNRNGSGSGHVISQGLISPPSSNEELGSTAHDPLPATQLLHEPISQEHDSNATPKASQERRRGRSTKAAETEQEKEKDAPAPTTQRPTSPVRRRLRSASRELPESPRITTRRVSAQSQASDVSSSQPLSQGVRRSTRRTTPVRSSQVDQLDSSQARPVVNTTIPEDVEGEAEKEQEAQLETPLVPETQLSQTPTPLPNGHVEETTPTQTQSQRSPRKRNRTAPSPLFMSQGSQIQPTQAYNLFPTRGSSSILSLHSDPVDESNANGNALGVGLDSSPLITPRAGAGKKRNSVRISSPILEDVEDHTSPSLKEATPPSMPALLVNGNGNDSESMQTPVTANGDKVDPQETEVNGDASSGENKSGSDSGSDSNSGSGSDSEIETDAATPLAKPVTIPKFQASRHVTIPSSFPTLSSLPREALRKKTPSTSAFSQAVRPTPDKVLSSASGSRRQVSMSQPTPRKGRKILQNQNQDQESSDSSSSSSSEDDAPKNSQLKGRYAGRKTRSTSAAATTVRGW